MLSDPNHIELLRLRDTEAWDALYSAMCQRTYRLIYCVTKADSHVVEELNQDVWLSAIAKVEQPDDQRGSPIDWILGIARYQALGYLRREYARCLAYVGDATDFPDPISSGDSASAIQAGERLALLQAAIASLPDHWQFVLRQKYEVGMSVSQLAQLTHLTPKAIESTLSRARQRLRRLMRITNDSDYE